MLDDLADYGAPVILFSGGEPLMRQDLLELIGYAKQKGLRAVISTNGTLITRATANELKNSGSPMWESVWTVLKKQTTVSGVFQAHLMQLWKVSEIACLWVLR